MDFNSIIARVKNIVVAPDQEWLVVAESEKDITKNQVLTGYAIPFIVVGAIAAFVGTAFLNSAMSLLGAGAAMKYAIIGSVSALIMGLVSIFISAFIVDALAPSFGGVKNMDNAMKLVIYSSTPSYIISIIAGFLPFLGILQIAALYGIYLYWTGLTPMMQVPTERRVGYLVVIILVSLVVYFVVGAILAMLLGTLLLGGLM